MTYTSVFSTSRRSVLLLCLLAALPACKKEVQDTLPIVITVGIEEVTANTAKVLTRVTDEGGAQVTGTGVCWATSELPDLSDQITNVGQGTGDFTSILTGLTPQTTYHVRAFATNQVGTAYGTELMFTTLP